MQTNKKEFLEKTKKTKQNILKIIAAYRGGTLAIPTIALGDGQWRSHVGPTG